MKLIATKIDPPTIVFTGELDAPLQVAVVAEKEVICNVDSVSLVDGFVVYMATCYVFMFPYPPASRNVCYYIQKSILDIQDGKKIPTTLVTFLNDLDKLISK